MTDAQYNAWLVDPSSLRMVLLEPVVRVGGVEQTRYLSTGGFVTGAAETPTNQFYLPSAVASITSTETLTLDSSATMSVGDVEINNADGTLDSWLNDVWVNRALPSYLGDPSWPRADFRPFFNGVTADIGSKTRDKLGLKLRDKLQRLNAALSEVKLKDVITDPAVLATLSNKDAIIPLCFGECHNVTPLLTNPATLEYQVHNGAIQGFIEIRDNGIPLANDSIGWAAVTVDLANGKFRLTSAPAGAVTVSVQGDKFAGVYANTVCTVIQRLVTGFGKAADRFSTATNVDLDTSQLASFNAAHQQPVGIYISDGTGVISACQQLASSLGAQMVMSRAGLLRILQIDLSSLVSTYSINATQMVERELTITQRTEVVAAVKLGFCKDWTLQPALQTAIPAIDKESFDTEWLTSTALDATVQSVYKLTADPAQIDTMLIRRTDADAEAARQLNLRKVPHAVYQFIGYAEMLQLVLGQIVTITHSRFNLAAGGIGMVVSLTPDPVNNRVTVGVLI